jgi:hypothetical protein
VDVLGEIVGGGGFDELLPQSTELAPAVYDFGQRGAMFTRDGNRAPARTRVEAREPTRGSPGASLTSTARSNA